MMASDQQSPQESDQESDYVLGPEIGYSREETVAAMQDFIAFATKMYVDETAYESPPSTGWPSITADSMRLLGKTDEVVDLLRHLPYPRDMDPDMIPEVMPALSFVSFQLLELEDMESASEFRRATEGMISGHVPAHVVGLALRPRLDHGVLLDTKLGVVFWHEAATEFRWFSPFPVALGLDDLDGDSMSEGERAWRECDTVWSIPDFFATLKHNLRELHFVPMSRQRVVDGWYGPEHGAQEAIDMVKGIYRAHGWPDLDRYRKKDCLKAIYTALSENFPDEVDDRDAELLEDADA